MSSSSTSLSFEKRGVTKNLSLVSVKPSNQDIIKAVVVVVVVVVVVAVLLQNKLLKLLPPSAAGIYEAFMEDYD